MLKKSMVRGRTALGTFALGVSLLSLIVVAQPAAALGVGEGVGSGEETAITEGDDYGSGVTPFCLEITATEYVVDVTGVFSAIQGVTAATYTGAARLTFTTNEDYFIAPEGTYGNATLGSGCDPTSLGPLGPVDTTLVVTDPDAGAGGISCTIHSNGATTGYSRIQSDFLFIGQGSCTVTANDGVTQANTGGNTQHVFDGVVVPCLDGMVPPGCVATTVTGAWTYGA
jgi:hypothetical protein